MSKPTTASNALAIAALNSRFDTLEALIVASLGGQQKPAKPAKATKATKATKAKATKPAAKAPAKPKVVTVEGEQCDREHTFLTQGTRKEFIADHEWAAPGMSTRVLLEAVLLQGLPLTGDWAIGPRNRERIAGSEPTAKAVSPDVVVAVAAKTVKAAPAKAEGRTEAQIAAASAPRKANGSASRKCEWALREDLAMTGKFDRHEIDAKVEAAYGNEALAEIYGLVAK